MPTSVSQFTGRFLFKVTLAILLAWLGDWMFFNLNSTAGISANMLH